MESPRKSIFGRAVTSIFGPATPLTNEPTIDYNNTIQTYGHNENIISPQGPQSQWDTATDTGTGPYSRKPDSKYRELFRDEYIIDLRVLDDSDDELNTDIDYIFDKYKHTNEVVGRMPRGVGELDELRLPDGYPGRYPSPLSRVGAPGAPRGVSVERDVDRDLRTLEREVDLEQDINTARLNARYNEYAGGSRGTGKLGTVELGTGGGNDRQLRAMVERVSDRNRFLAELNEYVDLSGLADVPANITDKYNALRAEYIKELSACQNFYRAYYKLVFKYRNLKKHVTKPTATSLREKVNLIRSTSLQLSIRTLCDSLLGELSDNDRLISHYQNELARANLKIKHLESQLNRGPST